MIQKISYTKPYYEIYQVENVIPAFNTDGSANADYHNVAIEHFLFAVETKEVAEQICRDHSSLIWHEKSVEASATYTTTTTQSVVLD